MRQNNRSSKFDPLVESVRLISSNPVYSIVQDQFGRVQNVSTQNLASEGDNRDDLDSSKQPETINNGEKEESTQLKEDSTLTINETCCDQTDTHLENVEILITTYLRRSNRTIRKTIRYRELRTYSVEE
ncbi:hypothetical protein GJ496_001533 [Pomphorhynchus laevis]|nr:hypothetical protein GJ496_001533 [Pomphorhynchus laevis]